MLKQSLQYTGRSPRGRNGTIASFPHSAQLIGYISLGPSWYIPADLCSDRRTARQLRQRLGSLPNPLAWKNSCSPAVKMNSPPHSTQFKVLSVNATGKPPESVLRVSLCKLIRIGQQHLWDLLELVIFSGQHRVLLGPHYTH